MNARLAVAWLMISLSLGGCRGDASQPADRHPAPDAPQLPAELAGQVSISSLRDLNALADELGLPVPGSLRRGSIEQTIRFLKGGDLRLDRPLGWFIIAGEALPRERRVIMGLPLKPEAASLPDLLRAGAQPHDILGGTVFFEDTPARRTEGYLWFGGTAPLIEQVHDELLTAPHEDPSRLLHIRLDLETFDQIAPAQLQQMHLPPEGQDDPEAQRLAYNLAESLRNFDEMELSLSRQSERLKVALQLAPVEAQPVQSFPRPVMPEGLFLRTDVAYPSLKVAHEVAAGAQRLLRFADLRPGEQSSALFGATSPLFIAEAISIGAVSTPEGIVYCQVNQYSEPKQFVQWMKSAAQLQSPDPADDTPQAQVDFIEIRTPGGGTVTRAMIRDGAGAPLVLDIAEHGRRVQFSLRRGDAPPLDWLGSTQTGGQIRASAQGFIDVGRALAAGVAGNLPEGWVGLEQLKGKTIDWTAAWEAGVFTFEFSGEPSIFLLASQLNAEP